MPLQLDEDPATARLVNLLGQEDAEIDDKGRVELQLEGYDYRWLPRGARGYRRLTPASKGPDPTARRTGARADESACRYGK